MNITILWIVVGLLAVTSVGVMLVRDWRYLIIFLSVQYIGVFVLTLQHWTIGMAAAKVIAGWMSAAVLGMTQSNFADEPDESREILPQGRLFRFIAAIMGSQTGNFRPFHDKFR